MPPLAVMANLTTEETVPLPGEVVSLPSPDQAMPHPSILEVAETGIRYTTDNDQVALKELTEEPLSYNFSKLDTLPLSSSDNSCPTFDLSEPNTGVVLWFQQFWAMFVKRFYNSLRFYSALVSQLFLPLLFVVFALVVVVTAPDRQADDAPRAMLINNSAQTQENATVFFAQFGGSLDLSVSDVCLFVCLSVFLFGHILNSYS